MLIKGLFNALNQDANTNYTTNKKIFGDTYQNTIEGTYQNDEIHGLGGNDHIYGNDGDDEIFGGAGTDYLVGDAGNDLLDGGAGWDMAAYNGQRSDYNVVKMADGTVKVYSEKYGVDELRNIENLYFADEGNGGTHYDLNDESFDVFIGDNTRDDIEGNNKANTIKGNDGNDKLYGNGGNDHLYGDAGHDYLVGGLGDDMLDGGSGNDVAGYEGKMSEYTVTKNANGTYTVSHDKYGTDTLTNIENIYFKGEGHDGKEYKIDDLTETPTPPNENDYTNGDNHQSDGPGTPAADHITNIMGDRTDEDITGNSNNNKVKAGGGDDLIYGLGGNDNLYGNAGGDCLFGGTGNDMLSGGWGDDHLDGGTGVDTAKYKNDSSEYTVAKNDDGSYTVTHDGKDGTDTLYNIENIKFADTDGELDSFL